MAFGDNQLGRNSQGEDVIELQLRLCGFRGTTWDGDYGPGTELQVRTFQKEVMEQDRPSGVADKSTLAAIINFGAQFPVDFSAIRCPCGQCQGFGQGRFVNEYRQGKPKVEAYYNREYPGIHKAILYAFQGACFHLVKNGFPKPFISSGYRCWIHNEMKGRQSTNHMGKALDLDFALQAGEDKRDDQKRCDQARGLLVEKSNFQIGWGGSNSKAFEPSDIAPTWVHMDIRCYQAPYLDDKFFVTSAEQL